jgi:hypothetical protein
LTSACRTGFVSLHGIELETSKLQTHKLDPRFLDLSNLMRVSGRFARQQDSTLTCSQLVQCDSLKEIMTLLWLLLLIICWSHFVQTQPLVAAQHAALMTVYNGIGKYLPLLFFAFEFVLCFFGQDVTRPCARDSVRGRIVMVKWCFVVVAMSCICVFLFADFQLCVFF